MFPKRKKKTVLPDVRRLPGQSLRDEKERLLDNRFLPAYLGTAFLWILWAVDEYRVQIHAQPAPKVTLCLAIVATGICLILFRRLFGHFRRLNRGERGELRVAEILDELRASGYRVYHDLVEDGFNVDHVVVGPTGVYAIETKFRSGSGVIEYRNGDGLFIGTNKLDEDRKPLAQARGSARAVRQRLKDDTGLNRHVKAVLVFVGDWKIKNVWRDTDVAVLSTKELPAYFDRYQPELKRDELKLIASHLERSAKS